jgi:diacylglycerol kinase (ATP)
MRVLVVRNAGSGSAGDVPQDRLAEALSPLGDVAFESPESDDELRHAAEAIELVVAAGGDGTVSRTVGALADRLADLTFAVVPLGTGNDFARTLGMPEDPLEAARAIADGTDRPIDVWRASASDGGRLFVNACVGGFPVEVDRRIGDREKQVLGPVAYLTAGARTVAAMDRFTASLDGRRLADCLAVGVGNGRSVGGGIRLFPEADPADGRLEACALSATGTVDVAKLGLAVRKGEHLGLDGVVATSGETIRIETDPPIELNVDGDLVGMKTPVEFRQAGRARFRC